MSPSFARTNPTSPFHPATSHPRHSSRFPFIDYRTRPEMFYDDSPYTSHIGPAVMPSPHSQYAPFYSGPADSFGDFLEEFESRAYDCKLTDPERIDAIVRYVDPSLRNLCRALNGPHSRDWPQFRRSLIKLFGSTTLRQQVRRHQLLSYIQDSSEKIMGCVDDVSQYYRQFLCYSAPLVHTGDMPEEERDTAFWYGFHPEDREALRPRLLAANPFQSRDLPYPFENIFRCACEVFAYDHTPSWSHAKQFEPPNVKRGQSVAEQVSRDSYNPREVTHTVASNIDSDTSPSGLPSSFHSSSDPQLSLSSLSASESQHAPAHSVTNDQSESGPTSASPISPSSTLLSSTSPIPSSLAQSAAEDVLEITPTSPLSPSIAPTPISAPTPSIPPSALIASESTSPAPLPTDAGPEFVSVPPSPSITPTELEFLPFPVHSVRYDQPESEPSLFHSITPTSLALPSTSSLAPSHTNDVPELALSSPSEFSPSILSADLEFLPPPVRSAKESQPEPEHESTLSVPRTLSSPSITSTELEQMAIVEQMELEPASMSPTPPRLEVELPPRAPLPAPEHSSHLSVNRVLSPSMFESPPALLSKLLVLGNLELKSSSPTPTIDTVPLSFPHRPPSSSYDTIPPLPTLLETPLNDSVLSIATPFEFSPNDTITPLQRRPPEVTPVCSMYPPLVVSLDALVSVQSQPPQSPLVVTPASTVSTPLKIMSVTGSASPTISTKSQQVHTSLENSPVAPSAHIVPQTVDQVLDAKLAPRLPHPSPPLQSSGSSSPHFHFAFSLVTTAAFISTLIDILTTHARKFRSKTKDLGTRNGNYKSGKTIAQRLPLQQYTPCAAHFVFDPGGLDFSLDSANEDIRERKPKTSGTLVTTCNTTFVTFVLVHDSTVFQRRNPRCFFI